MSNYDNRSTKKKVVITNVICCKYLCKYIIKGDIFQPLMYRVFSYFNAVHFVLSVILERGVNFSLFMQACKKQSKIFNLKSCF